MTPMGSGMGGMSSGSLGGSGLYGGPPPPGRLGAGSASLGAVGALQQQRQQQMQSPSLLGGACRSRGCSCLEVAEIRVCHPPQEANG